MTKLVHRVRAFAPKAKTGCRTCRERRVKCDEGKPSCKKCLTGDRKCQWYDAPSSTASSTSPENSEGQQPSPGSSGEATPVFDLTVKADLPPSSLGFGLNAQERSSIGFFINRTCRDLGFSFPSTQWLSYSLQLGHEEPSIRYAMVALGQMHRARKAFTHTSLLPNLDQKHFQFALDGYGKAIMHLRRRVDNSTPSEKHKATNMIILSCLLFFCFEQLQGNQPRACDHMARGQRIIKELQSTEHQLEPFLVETYGLFSGFDNINFESFQREMPSSSQDPFELASKIPRAFSSFAEANRHLNKLEDAKFCMRRELLGLAHEALNTLESVPTDPAVVLCLQHCLSRAIDFDNHEYEHLGRNLRALKYAYSVWIEALSNTVTRSGGSPEEWAVKKIQALTSRFTVRLMQDPSERITDEYDGDFSEVLNLAEGCLLIFPSTNDSPASVEGPLTECGYGLALGTDLLPQIATCGFKSRSTLIRERAMNLLTAANKNSSVYQSAILSRFIRRPMEREQQRAMWLGYLPGPDGHYQASQIPEEARVADTVFAQVRFRPKCLNSISCRFTRNEKQELRIEVMEDVCDLFTGADVSNTVYDVPVPESCQRAVEVVNPVFTTMTSAASGFPGTALSSDFSNPNFIFSMKDQSSTYIAAQDGLSTLPEQLELGNVTLSGAPPPAFRSKILTTFGTEETSQFAPWKETILHPVSHSVQINPLEVAGETPKNLTLRTQPTTMTPIWTTDSYTHSEPKTKKIPANPWTFDAMKLHPELRLPVGGYEEDTRSPEMLHPITSRPEAHVTGQQNSPKVPIMHCP